ncbi:MAG: hypothetical protein ACR2J7_08600, partial [Luteimonas sp.]
MSQSPAPPRNGTLLAALSYAVTLVACFWLLKHPLADATIWLRAAVALLPMLPLAWMIRVMVGNVLAGDELQRRIDLEAVAVAGLVVGLGSLTLGLLVIAGAFVVTGRSVLIWVFPALVLSYGL